MSSPNQVPAYFRYLKARLQPLRQPQFWLSAMGFGLILLFIWEYWKHPNWLSFLEEDPIRKQFENSTDEKTLSAEELAANMANIDSSAVLIEEFDKQKALALANLPQPKSGNKKNALTPSSDQLLPSSSPDLNTIDGPKPSTINLFAKASQDFLMGNLSSGQGLFPLPNIFNSEPSSSNSATTSAKISEKLTDESANEFSQSSPQKSEQLTQGTHPSVHQTVPTTDPNLVPGSTTPRTIKNNGIMQPTYPPASVPTVSGYNGAGQLTYPTGITPNSTIYNGAGQPMYPSVPVPPSTPTGVINYPVIPTTPANSPNVGQYPVPSNSLPSPSNNSTRIMPGLQPSQLNRSQLNVPSR